MIVNVYQTITIQSLRVDSLANSSILQIGSAGMIKSLSNNYNTGGSTGPEPEVKPPEAAGEDNARYTPLVPLPSLH